MALDVTPLYSTLLGYLYWIIPTLILVSILKTSWFKGWFGELWVRLSTWLLLPKHEYHAFHNVTLQTLDGTTQIDHVFVSEFGVFVVETKMMKGWIFGSERQARWTQKIYKQTFSFQNPLRQNYKHVKALEAILDLPAEVFHSVIVFVGGSEFKTPMPDNVTMGSGVVSFIESTRKPLLTAEQVSEAVRRIESGRSVPSLDTHRKHVARLNSRSDVNSVQLCPRCGDEMELRTAKKGANAGKQFWGCTRFPQCRGLVNLK